MRLSELTQGLVDASIAAEASEVEIADVTDDSRLVQPGSLFIARAGVATHGGEFISQAVERGAVAVVTDGVTLAPKDVCTLRTNDVGAVTGRLAERFFGDPSRALTLIGVTGTNGKTTTAHLIQQIFDLTGRRCGLIGTICVDDGAERQTAHLTTPGAVEISRTLARMVANGCDSCVLEASSHAIEQGRVSALDFNACVFTNLTGDHLDYHGSIEQYAGAKAKLFEALTPGAVAVVNRDDPQWRRMARDCRARVVLCSSDPLAEAEAHVILNAESTGGQGVFLDGPWGRIGGSIRLLGAYNRMNLLQAVAAAHGVGVDVASLSARLHELAPPAGRMESVELADGGPSALRVLVDYAHTDDALGNALRAVRPIVPKGGKVWVVFGCGGDRDVTKRPRMGAVAAEHADVVVVTSDNPRTEEPMKIIEEIVAGVPESQRRGIILQSDREHAIEFAVREAAVCDLILIAGKGHEDYQIIPDGAGGTIRRDFDDRVVARRAMESRAQRNSSVRSRT